MPEPTPSQIEALVLAIHAAARPMALSATGGGSRALAELLTVPGASRTVLEARVPYAAAAVVDWLGGRPDQFCSEATARAMAMRSFQRARELLTAEGRDPLPAAGVGCTASLATDRPKRGRHRGHLALQTADATITVSVELVTGRRSRDREESVIAALLLNLVAEGAGCELVLDAGLEADEPLTRRQCGPRSEWRALLLGDTNVVPAGEAPRGVFPGAFNPRHAGHRQMAAAAQRRLGGPVAHELSIVNVDKPPLDYLELEARSAQFPDNELLLLTRAPTFVEKARLFPGATFVVGADTIRRIGDPRYYGGDTARRDAALAELAAQGARFLVFGRVVGSQFESLADLDLPPALRALCDAVPEAEFRQDVSSSELRRQGGNAR